VFCRFISMEVKSVPGALLLRVLCDLVFSCILWRTSLHATTKIHCCHHRFVHLCGGCNAWRPSCYGRKWLRGFWCSKQDCKHIVKDRPLHVGKSLNSLTIRSISLGCVWLLWQRKQVSALHVTVNGEFQEQWYISRSSPDLVHHSRWLKRSGSIEHG